MKLKDLNQQFALEQLREKCKSYQQYRIENYGDSNQIEYMDYDLSDKTIEYLVFGIRDAVLDQFAVYLNFTNKSYAQELLENLDEAHNVIASRELVDDSTLEALDQAIEYAENALELDDEESLLFTCDTIFNFDEDDDDLSKVQVVSIPVEHADSEYEEFRDELHTHLTRLKEALENALSASQELDEPQLTNALTEALSTHEELYKYFGDQLNNVDANSFTQQEFDICDFEVDEQELKEIIDKFDSIPRLRMSEVLDPMHVKAWLTTAPSKLIKNLTDLCDSTVVKKITPKNETLPNVVTLKDAIASCWVNDESQNANAFARSLLVNINRRIDTAEPRSKEKRILRKFKESITSYIHQLYAIYNTILPYTMQSRYSRPSHLVINAIETDMKNGNHNEKLRIIDELTRSVDLIKQSAESIDAACHDALSNAYSE